MQMWQSNSATVLCLLRPLILLIIAVSAEKYFDRSLFVHDISVASTEKQTELK